MGSRRFSRGTLVLRHQAYYQEYLNWLASLGGGISQGGGAGDRPQRSHQELQEIPNLPQDKGSLEKSLDEIIDWEEINKVLVRAKREKIFKDTHMSRIDEILKMQPPNQKPNPTQDEEERLGRKDWAKIAVESLTGLPIVRTTSNLGDVREKGDIRQQDDFIMRHFGRRLITRLIGRGWHDRMKPTEPHDPWPDPPPDGGENRSGCIRLNFQGRKIEICKEGGIHIVGKL